MCVGDEDLEAVCSCLKGAHTANLREWQCRSSHCRELITRTEQTCPLPSSCFYGISKAQLDAQPPEDMCLWTGKEVAKHHPLALQWGKKSIGAVAVMARAAKAGLLPCRSDSGAVTPAGQWFLGHKWLHAPEQGEVPGDTYLNHAACTPRNAFPRQPQETRSLVFSSFLEHSSKAPQAPSSWQG